MSGRFRQAMLLAALSAVPTVAHAGWIADWTNTAVKQNGERMDSQKSSMMIAAGRVRIEQPEIITVIDYNAGRFTLLNPQKQCFWSGTIDEYVREVVRSRSTGLREKLRDTDPQKKLPDTATKDHAPPTINPAKLPPLSIVKTGSSEKIAGYDAVKYEIRADGDLFQEMWVAPLDVSSDLDLDRFVTVQRKISAGRLGKSAGQFNALYLSDEYRKLLDKAFVLKMVTHHVGGGFERTATSVRQADVPASQFDVPNAYRKVKLSDVMPAPPGS